MTGGESDLDDLQPPSAAQVARRALILAVVSCRGILEMDPARDQAQQFWSRVDAWSRRLELDAYLEPAEATLLRSSFGTASQQELVDASWRSEALAVLAWALQKTELISHDVQVDPSAVASSLGFLNERTVLDSPCLRPSGEIAEYSNVAFTVHWRLREFSLNRGALDFAKFCQTAWFGPLSLNGVRLVDDDLALCNFSISRAPAPLVRMATSIARERHQAANWLIDASLPLSETDTST